MSKERSKNVKIIKKCVFRHSHLLSKNAYQCHLTEYFSVTFKINHTVCSGPLSMVDNIHYTLYNKITYP